MRERMGAHWSPFPALPHGCRPAIYISAALLASVNSRVTPGSRTAEPLPQPTPHPAPQGPALRCSPGSGLLAQEERVVIGVPDGAAQVLLASHVDGLLGPVRPGGLGQEAPVPLRPHDFAPWHEPLPDGGTALAAHS